MEVRKSFIYTTLQENSTMKMDSTTAYLLLLTLSSLITCLLIHYSKTRRADLPPGPYPLPIIGNFLQLRRSPHCSRTYGPLMRLNLAGAAPGRPRPPPGESPAAGRTLDMIMGTLFSMDSGSSDGELAVLVRGLMRVFGRTNVADFVPVLGRFWDPQGIKKEAEFYMGRLLDKFDCIIEERLESVVAVKRDDVLGGLLEMMDGDKYDMNRNGVKHLLLDLFLAGIDTTSGTVEWVMTELLRHPVVMSEARIEIQAVTDMTKSCIEESDIGNLPYLRNVIKETFRLHPPGPFLFRTCGEDDIKINKFNIPKNALVLINTWAIGRDSKTWTDPELFAPERFLNGDVDIKGHHFELIPFGAGKRMCPGISLAHTMVNVIVATLIRDFDWKLEHGLRPEDVDMDERFGLTLQKAMPLRAVPRKLA